MQNYLFFLDMAVAFTALLVPEWHNADHRHGLRFNNLIVSNPGDSFTWKPIRILAAKQELRPLRLDLITSLLNSKETVCTFTPIWALERRRSSESKNWLIINKIQFEIVENARFLPGIFLLKKRCDCNFFEKKSFYKATLLNVHALYKRNLTKDC